jgi:hypothetical protein
MRRVQYSGGILAPCNFKKADFEKFIPKNAKVGLGFSLIILDNETNF